MLIEAGLLSSPVIATPRVVAVPERLTQVGAEYSLSNPDGKERKFIEVTPGMAAK